MIIMPTDELKYYREKYSEIGTLIEKLQQYEDYREALLESIDRNLPAFLRNKTHNRTLSELIPMSEDLAHKVRAMMIENLDEEIKILRNKLDEIL